MLSKTEFVNKIKYLPKTIPSKTGSVSYTGFKIDENRLYFQRVIPKTNWSLDISILYTIYKTQKFINTSIIKSITKGRVNSPSVAILLAIGCIDKNGFRNQ